MPEKIIYLGASIRGASDKEKSIISSHVKIVCGILDTFGYRYHIDKSMLDTKVNRANPDVEIPKKFYSGISESLVEKIAGLRDENETLRDDIAMCRWTDYLLENSSGGIWLHDRSQTGLGIEVLRALFELERHCLVLYSTRSVSSLLKGRTTRLLMTRRWNDETVENAISEFIKKIEGKYDHARRILLSAELDAFAEKRAKELALAGVPEYLRDLIRQDREGR